MAADCWIKMRTDLPSSPKVVRMASALNADRFRVIGGLLAVWSLFDAHSVDGVLLGYSLAVVDELIGWPGFAEKMEMVEWLVAEGDALSIPRFDEHNGQSAKRRAMEALRKRLAREAEAAASALASASDPDKKRTRGEESSSVAKATGAGAPPEPVDQIFALGIPLLTVASCSEKNARSMLGLLRKQNGDDRVIAALQRCAEEKPLEPVSWLQAALKSDVTAKPGSKGGMPWWSTDATTIAKGRELGLESRPGEEMQQFKGRIQVALDSPHKAAA